MSVLKLYECDVLLSLTVCEPGLDRGDPVRPDGDTQLISYDSFPGQSSDEHGSPLNDFAEKRLAGVSGHVKANV